MPGPILLEICIASPDDALAAQSGGADRLELNCALALGGLTPSPGSLREVRQATTLPIVAMIRPRAGGFCYSAADFRVMQHDLETVLNQGVVDAVAFGLLDESCRIDLPRCRELLRQAGNTPAVFHRAFDLTPDPFAALAQLTDLGFRRVLTSGQAGSALQRADLIAELIRRAQGRIEILPAAGVTAANVAELIARTGCTQVHASCRTLRADPTPIIRPGLDFGSAPPPAGPNAYEVTDGAAVAALSAALRGPSYDMT